MNAFYALVSNIRDAHHQILSGSSNSKEKERKRENENKKKSTWTPSFSWEDFAEYEQFRGNHVMPPSSSKNHQEQPKNQELGVEKLSGSLNFGIATIWFVLLWKVVFCIYAIRSLTISLYKIYYLYER
ncbi:hypothetical protein Tsubulata_047755 [Turnera subulata]|uniref:Uncharacterized protein n=1 Tax=Turnera subulata TaxID=218843 RepID=A0A9Q0J1B6_9ROSI|nr:hypothetical protein Tsubulata_047755 [Turnera subulata]